MKTKEEKAQKWVYENVDTAPDVPYFEEIYLAGYSQALKDAAQIARKHGETIGENCWNHENRDVGVLENYMTCSMQIAKDIEELAK